MAWRGIDGPPRSYLARGEWPTGRVRADAPVAAEVARRLCVALAEQLEGRGVREVARAADLNHTTLLAVLRGDSWPDLVTIARLEAALGCDLWPGRV